MSKKNKKAEPADNFSVKPGKKGKRGPGDYWPWKATVKGGPDAWPWKPLGFEGFSDASPGWYAWLNTMPVGPHSLHVVGDVLVSNPGVSALLTMRNPQGFSPRILMLDLSLVQQPGVWPQIVAHVQAKFDRYVPSGSTQYQSVEVFLNAAKIVSIDHIDVVS